MKFTPYIIERLGKMCGRSIQIPADCEFLALDIESKTKTRIGATTLKRLMGFTRDERKPHATTLNAIANYLEYRSWDELMEIAGKGNSAMGHHEHELRSSGLAGNCIVEITYKPDRRIAFRHLGNNTFIVEESINSKLQKGDEAVISHFVLHHPLYAANVKRKGDDLGEYTAGIISGISSIKVTEK